MKNQTTKTAHVFLFLAVIFMLTSAFTKHRKYPKDEVENACLEISGKVHFSSIPEDRHYKLELIQGNEVTKTLYIKDRSGFSFVLQKGAYYSIRISKKGYMSKLISICTIMEKEPKDRVYHKFHFDTELIAETDAGELNPDILDFPIAVISYDCKRGSFYNSEKYTASIKKMMHKKQISSN